MTTPGNSRRPRSGAPERPDLRKKAEKIHAEVFGHQEESNPPPGPDRWWIRPLAGFGLAVFCWIMSAVYNSDYLQMFALSLAAGLVFIMAFKLIVLRRKK
jgi:hypothetical protein